MPSITQPPYPSPRRRYPLSLVLLAASLAVPAPSQSPKLHAAPTAAPTGYSLATTTTQLTSSTPNPTTGQSTTLSAIITPGPGSSTPAGIYVPGPPSGSVTFTDPTTALGSAPLLATTLTFGAASPQTIATPSGVASRVSPGARSRPNDTPAPATSSGFSSILADFNLDGIKDALLLDPNSGTMHLFLGSSPGGNFLADHLISIGAACFTGVTVADLNGDGFADIAYLCANPTNNSATLFALLNLGNGTFAPPVALLSPTGAPLLTAGTQLGSGDLNRDGKIDLVVTGPITASATPAFGIQTFFGDGAGHFTAGPVTPASADPGTQLTVTDLNHDGAADLVLFASSPQTYTTAVQPFQNDGAGNFTAMPLIPVCSCFTYTSKLFVTPLTTNTAYPDILVALTDQQQTLVALNQHTPTIAFASPLTQSIPNLADAVVGDLTGDGLADLTIFDGSNISVLNGDGSGNFAAQSSSPTFTASTAGVSLVAAADFNQDGYADLLTIFPASTFTSTINTFITTGTATATLPATFSTAAIHTITATYPGNIDLLGSTATLSLPVQPSVYTAALSITAPPSSIPASSATQAYTPGGTFSLNFTLTQTTDPSLGGFRTPGGTITVSENGIRLGSATPIPATPGASTAALTNFGTASAGVHILTVAYTGDSSYAPLTQTFVFTVTTATPTITWSVPATIQTTTPLDASLLTAIANIAGTFRYTPPSGYLAAGSQTLSVLFTPTDAVDYSTITTTRTVTVLKANPSSGILAVAPANQTFQSGVPTVLTATIAGSNLTPTGTIQFFDGQIPLGSTVLAGASVATAAAATFSIASLAVGPHTFSAAYQGDAVYNPASFTTSYTVAKATPVIAFSSAPTAIVGTALATLQLNPTVTGPTGVTVPGTISFNPNVGLVIAGPQTLTVTFVPTDAVDYNNATTTITLNGTALALSALSSSNASLGDPDKTFQLTGTGFAADSVARANGVALATTFISTTTLTAVLPAANFLTPRTIQITVLDPTQAQTSGALPFTVAPPPVGTITFSAPTTANSGEQPAIRFALTNPYPVALSGSLTLTFTPIAGGVDDPAIQFFTGGRTFPFTLAAGQTASPTIQLQSGTVAGTIRITLLLTAAGVDVTPASVTPIIITIAPAAPGITSVTLTRTGRQLTVQSFGFSNTRAISQASFHFTPAPGQQIQTQDIPLDVTSLFSGWYSQAVSDTYGSAFLYTQTFTLDEDATVVGQVTLILSNGVGNSASGSSN